MNLRNKYLILFFSSAVLTFIVVGVSFWGFDSLRNTTDYLVTVNSRVLEFANNFDKALAHSRRAEKEFFIFPNNEKKQSKYIAYWQKSYKKMRRYLDELKKLFTRENNKQMLQLMVKADLLMDENELEFATVISKFKQTKSYDFVNEAEYGSFKKRTHILEDIALKISRYGLAEVQKGRKALSKTQRKSRWAIQIIAIIAILWGIFLPIFLSHRLTSFILYLTQITNDISKGKLKKEIRVDRKDELGELAISIKRMQKSLKIMMAHLAKKYAQST